MADWLWPAWVQVAVGALGAAWGVSILASLRGRPARPTERLNAIAIFVLGALLLVAGALRAGGIVV